MGGFNDFSTTASSNASVGAINFSEGQLPSTLNNSARQLMADLADVRDGNVVATGFHVKANGLTIRDQSDTTKKVIFDVSGQSAGTTKTIAMPTTGGTLALTSDLTTYAPLSASYIVVGSNGTLTAERVLTAGSNITITDSSTAGTITVAASAPATGFTLGTPQASTSGTSIDFTSIPAGTKKITVTLVGVSTNGTSSLIVQIGDSGGVETSSYTGAAALDNSSITSYTAGFGLDGTTRAAAGVCHGELTLTLVDSSTFTWVASGHTYNGTNFSNCVGSKSLSAELDRVRVTTVNGTDTFDAGKINIAYIG